MTMHIPLCEWMTMPAATTLFMIHFKGHSGFSVVYFNPSFPVDLSTIPSTFTYPQVSSFFFWVSDFSSGTFHNGKSSTSIRESHPSRMSLAGILTIFPFKEITMSSPLAARRKRATEIFKPLIPLPSHCALMSFGGLSSANTRAESRYIHCMTWRPGFPPSFTSPRHRAMIPRR